MEFQGTIKATTQPAEGVSKITGNPWRRQGFVIESNAEPVATSVYFEVFNDRIEQMTQAGMTVGAVGTVSIDFHTRQYNGRWFNDVRGWEWTPAQSWQEAAQGLQTPAAQTPAYPVREQRPAVPLNMAATQQGRRIPAATEQSLPIGEALPF